MLTKLQSCAPCALALLLSACGGGSAPTSLEQPSVDQDVSTQIDEFDRISNLIDAADATDPANLPASGAAVFEGNAQFLDDVVGEAGESAVAQTVVNVDFGSAQLDGLITNFRTSEGGSLDGTLIIEQTNIEDGVFGTVATGQLSAPGLTGDVDTGDVDLNVDGFFAGPDGNLIGAVVDGTVTTNGLATTDLNGTFAVERK